MPRGNRDLVGAFAGIGDAEEAGFDAAEHGNDFEGEMWKRAAGNVVARIDDAFEDIERCRACDRELRPLLGDGGELHIERWPDDLARMLMCCITLPALAVVVVSTKWSSPKRATVPSSMTKPSSRNIKP